MKPARFLLAILFAAMVLSFSHARAGTEADPTAVVQGLYHEAFNHFGFSPESVKLAKPYVTPALYARLWKTASKPVPKGDAPDIEGDIFLNSQETPTSFDVGESAIHDDMAIVKVSVNVGGDNRQYTVLLERIDSAWKVSNIDFGGDGKLTDQL
ncbi:MAG TPA: hypothetical protein VGC39_00010 [Candidatus Methylacidiphilales bacterium]